MKLNFCPLSLVLMPSIAFAESPLEFGRTSQQFQVKRKRRYHVDVGPRYNRDQFSHVDFLDELVELENLERNLQLSMSMAPSQSPTEIMQAREKLSAAPSQPPSVASSNVPSYAPSVAPTSSIPSMIPTVNPSLAPTMASVSPTELPSGTPSGEPTQTSNTPSTTPTTAPTTLPSSSPSTQATSLTPDVPKVYDCVDGIVTEVLPPFGPTTEIQLNVGYLVEAFTDNADDFIDALDNLMFLSVLLAALECVDPGALVGRSLSVSRTLTSTSEVVGSCESTQEDTTCFLMEADIVLRLNDAVLVDVASYLAYTTLQEDMDQTFAAQLEDVFRVMYLRPVPVLPAIPNDGSDVRSVDDDDRSVSPWAYGAAIAMSVGGVMALAVWFRSRNNRNRRHIELMDETSQPAPQENPAGEQA